MNNVDSVERVTTYLIVLLLYVILPLFFAYKSRLRALKTASKFWTLILYLFCFIFFLYAGYNLIVWLYYALL